MKSTEVVDSLGRVKDSDMLCSGGTLGQASVSSELIDAEIAAQNLRFNFRVRKIS